METLAATPLNLLTPADVHGRREPADVNGADAGAFEELLGNEIALIAPEAGTAAAAELLTKTLTPATDDTAQPADGTQMLDAILDSASMLPAAAIPALIPNVQGVSQPGDARPAHGHAITPATIQAPLVGVAGEIHVDAATAQTAESAGGPLPDMAAPETRVATAQAASIDPSAPSAPATTAKLVATTRNTPPSAEALALAQKSAVPGHKPPTAAAQPPAVNEPRENHQPAASQPREELLVNQAEANIERRQIEAFVTASATEKSPAPDVAAQPATTTSSLDALSSAALMPKWAPASHTSSGTTTSTPATARIDTPLGTEGWGDAFRQKVVWLVDRQQQSAELHVNPPHLGPVEVMLNLGDDGARIVFCSPHASVREAIEASLAELRTALANNGLSLGQALVSADPGAAREQFREEMVRNPQATANTSADSLPTNEIQATKPLRQGLVDIFA